MSHAQNDRSPTTEGGETNELSSEVDTGGVRLRLLDTAERLFGEQGVAETSVRAITGAAGLNVALVNYYFGSKENLVRAVVERRQGPLNAERLRLLDASQTDAAERVVSGPPSALDSDAVLYALVAPALRLAFQHPHFARLASRLRLDPDRSLWRDYRAGQQEVTTRFQQALGAALPHLEEDEVTARLHFVQGAIAHVWAHCPLPTEETPDRLLARFLTFYGAALRAPAPLLPRHENADKESLS
jgi:AcrR family transcriptional regulator